MTSPEDQSAVECESIQIVSGYKSRIH